MCKMFNIFLVLICIAFFSCKNEYNKFYDSEEGLELTKSHNLGYKTVDDSFDFDVESIYLKKTEKWTYDITVNFKGNCDILSKKKYGFYIWLTPMAEEKKK